MGTSSIKRQTTSTTTIIITKQRKDMILSGLKLTPLCINFNKWITDEEAKYIFSKIKDFKIKQIEFTNFAYNPNCITFETMIHMSRMKWDSLTYLNVTRNNIGDKGCKYLIKIHMPNLKQVFLSSNNIGDAGLLHLSKGKWENLYLLSISSRLGQRRDWMGVDAYYFLIKGNWRNLQRLLIDKIGLTQVQAKIVLLCGFLLKSIFICLHQVYSVNDQMGTRMKYEIRQKLKSKYPQALIYN